MLSKRPTGMNALIVAVRISAGVATALRPRHLIYANLWETSSGPMQTGEAVEMRLPYPDLPELPLTCPRRIVRDTVSEPALPLSCIALHNFNDP